MSSLKFVCLVCIFTLSHPQSLPVTVLTPDLYSYQWVNVLGVNVACRNSISFSVQACNDVHIALADRTTALGKYYEVVIGGWANTQSIITNARLGPILVSRHNRLLSCKEEQDFWISWTNGRVAVGTGSFPGQGEFMSYQDTSPYSVNYLGISTGWGATGKFIFNSRSVVTPVPNEFRYQYVLQDYINFDCQQYLRFDVKACSDVHLALSRTTDSNADTYEIVIGGWTNSKSVIRRCKQCPAELDTFQHSPLNCNSVKSFWVTWNGGRIAVGTGATIGDEEFMSYNDDTPYDIHNVGFTTGFGYSGVFLVKIS